MALDGGDAAAPADAQVWLVTPHFKSHGNVGPLVRASSAFSAAELLLVGEDKFTTHGAHGSQKHVQVVNARDWEEATSYLKDERGCDVFAIVPPSHPGAEPVHRRNFRRSTAFVLALSSELAQVVAPMCDRAVCVTQAAPGVVGGE